jgi:two-component system phosphate regulon response regulator OmpR
MGKPATPERQRILVVDDDPRLRKLLTRYLSDQGFDVDTAPGAAEMDRQMSLGHYDLMILDVMMPGESGFAVCQRLRGAGNPISVIMLTAKADDVDRIVGLELGADDYLSKPFNPRELVARINAVLRRQAPVSLHKGRTVRFGRFELNLDNRALTRDGEVIPLTTGEFSVLKALTMHAGEPLSREKLMELARGREHDDTARTIDVQISRLRRLLGDDPQRPRIIRTVWGYGYMLAPEEVKA